MKKSVLSLTISTGLALASLTSGTSAFAAHKSHTTREQGTMLTLGTAARPLVNCSIYRNTTNRFPSYGGSIYTVSYRTRVINGETYSNSELSINGTLYPNSSVEIHPTAHTDQDHQVIVYFFGPGNNRIGFEDEILTCTDPNPPPPEPAYSYPNVY
jgi:hypothetical protein